MKINELWSSAQTETRIFRTLTWFLVFFCVLLAMDNALTSAKNPIIIERGGGEVSVTAREHTHAEIEQFLQLALPARFDTVASDPDIYLSERELQFRRQEQLILSQRNVDQKILIRSVQVEGGTIDIDADRVLAFGEIRSALKSPMKVEIRRVKRTRARPFGLILSKATPNEQRDEDKK